LFTLVGHPEEQHSRVVMNALLLVAFHAVFAIEQTSWVDLTKLARGKQAADNFGAAEALRREAVRVAESELGPNDKRLAPILADLALNLHFEGRDADGEPFAQRRFDCERVGRPAFDGTDAE